MSPAIERGPDCTVVCTEAVPALVVVTFDAMADDIAAKLAQLPTEPSFFAFGGNPAPLEILAANLHTYLGRRYLARTRSCEVDNKKHVIRLVCAPGADAVAAKRHVIDYLLRRAGLQLSPRSEFEGDH